MSAAVNENPSIGVQSQQQKFGLDLVSPIQVETFNSFPVNQAQIFNIILADHCKPSDISVAITNSVLGVIDTHLDWIRGSQKGGPQGSNKCRVSFVASIVGLYTIDIINDIHPQNNIRFIAKAYDLSKVFIQRSQAKCRVNESYEFRVDASEAGEGQLEIAVNEGEIPNQVQVLDNGKCIVNFVPEEPVPHVVDIKFNGHNVKGCPFVVETIASNSQVTGAPVLVPTLKKEDRILVNTTTKFSIENTRIDTNSLKDILIVDPDGRNVEYRLATDSEKLRYTFEFSPKVVGDHMVEIRTKSELFVQLPQEILEHFPVPLKVFDYDKVFVSEVTDGVVGNPVYFFIDASQAGCGNLEIRVASSTRNVPNHPQSEANAKIRVHFTPTEAVDHSIDIKFNGISVPGNPFLVRVAQYPQARLPAKSRDLLNYVALDEFVNFYVDYIGNPDNKNMSIDELTQSSCQVYVLRPDTVYTKLDAVELIKTPDPKTNEVQAKFKMSFKPNKIGPYKFFITVNNELVPSCPIPSNVYNINEVKVTFNQTASLKRYTNQAGSTPIARLNQLMSFIVDASRAGEGTLALAVLSGSNRNPVQTEVNVSEKDHGLYELTFVPTEFAQHSIDMSFNDRTVPNSPFFVDIIDANGKLASPILEQAPKTEKIGQLSEATDLKDQITKQMVQAFEAMNVNQTSSLKKSAKSNVATTSKKSLAFGLVNANNIVYLESGILENSKNQVSLFGPNAEKVQFSFGKGPPRRGEPKKTYIEYKPKQIGTHTINVLENGRDLRQYFVEACDPSLAKITGLVDYVHVAGRPVAFIIESQKSGEIQIDNISILGPKIKVRDGDQTIMGRIKSISGSSTNNQNQPLEYSLQRLDDHQHEVVFVPQFAGKHIINVRSLGQPVASCPIEIDVKDPSQVPSDQNDQHSTNGTAQSREDDILRNIVVHGVSLKCSPVNSTGAFIIETDRSAQARDFDVLITDPNNSLVDVQCYLQQDGNLLAEWTPRRIGSHKIQVLFKDRPVPGSPFITEAFDPSKVVIDKIDSLVVSVNETIAFKVDRQFAGHSELDVAISSPAGHDLPIDLKTLPNESDKGEIISFKPTIAGKYKLSILFGGFEIPKSPLTFIVRDSNEPIKITGTGLRGAEVNRVSQFMIESSQEGQLKVRIECGEREIVPKIEQRDNLYTIKYKPTEIGYAAISVYWNGAHVDGSPFAVPVNDLSKILFLTGSNRMSNSNNQRIVYYEPNSPKEITLDTAKCGPGELVAEAYCRANPDIKFSIPADQFAINRYRLMFLCPPKREQIAKGLTLEDFSSAATYMIRFYYNNLSVPKQLASIVVSPIDASSPSTSNRISEGETSAVSHDDNNNSNKEVLIGKSKSHSVSSIAEYPIVSLRGHGLAEAKSGEKAEFTIDGSKAGSGKPEVRLADPDGSNVKVQLERIDDNMYQANYIPRAPGNYTLNVTWDTHQVAGCPLTVSVTDTSDPSKVICTEDGLKGGVQGEEIKVLIDTRRAGPGELTAICTGPQKVAFCELLDRGDGTFILYIKPQESGRHFLTIKYAGQHIPKSPFVIKVSGKPDPTKVRVHGPGVEHGVLSLYQSRFVCDTRGAGAGQLTVRIRGPKGAFRIETQRESQRDRTILCKYDPTEPGDYRIEIKWSGQHVPGSPFHVMIFDTQEELNRFLNGVHQNTHHYIHHPSNPFHNPKLSNAVMHQVPYQPALPEYNGHYSNLSSNPQTQPPYRL